MRAEIKLSKAQADWVDWALTGPIAEWSDIEQLCWDKDIAEQEARQAIRDRDSTTLDGGWLTIDAEPHGDFIADLLNMLEDVAPDVENGYGFEDAQTKHGWKAAHVITASRTKSALCAASKIREAMGLNQP